uniref:Uncharacterized protein n=1 Tax=Tetranychus urticae TaxID=32264 RepID=T1K395_TETUR
MATNSTSITRITTVNGEGIEEPVAGTCPESAAAPINGYYDVEKFTHCFRAVRNDGTHAELWAVAHWKPTPVRMSDIYQYDQHIPIRKVTKEDLDLLNGYDPNRRIEGKFKCRWCGKGGGRRNQMITHEKACPYPGSIRHNFVVWGCIERGVDCVGASLLEHYIPPLDRRSISSGRKSKNKYGSILCITKNK